jgi:hypothetical protein
MYGAAHREVTVPEYHGFVLLREAIPQRLLLVGLIGLVGLVGLVGGGLVRLLQNEHCEDVFAYVVASIVMHDLIASCSI